MPRASSQLTGQHPHRRECSGLGYRSLVIASREWDPRPAFAPSDERGLVIVDLLLPLGRAGPRVGFDARFDNFALYALGPVPSGAATARTRALGSERAAPIPRR